MNRSSSRGSSRTQSPPRSASWATREPYDVISGSGDLELDVLGDMRAAGIGRGRGQPERPAVQRLAADAPREGDAVGARLEVLARDRALELEQRARRAALVGLGL